jgi:hypothetical protein
MSSDESSGRSSPDLPDVPPGQKNQQLKRPTNLVDTGMGLLYTTRMGKQRCIWIIHQIHLKKNVNSIRSPNKKYIYF